MVPTQCARRSAAADVRQSGVPGVAPAKTQAQWRHRNRGYAIAYRIDPRATQTESPAEPMRVPAPLDRLPWEFAKDEFGSQHADFMGVMGSLMVRTAKDEFRAYLIDPTRVPGTLPHWSRKTRSEMGHSEPAGDDATGVSPTRAAMGTSARPPTAAVLADWQRETGLDDAVYRVAATIPLNGFQLDPTGISPLNIFQIST